MKTGLLLISLAMFSGMMIPASAQRFEAGTSTAVFGKRYDAAVLSEAAENGIGYIEVAVNQSYRGVLAEEVEERMRAAAASIDSSGIRVWSVHLPFSRTLDISVTDDSLRAENVKFMAGMIRLCSEIYRPERFVLHPSSEPIDDGERETRIMNAVASIRELSAVAEECGIPLCIENLPRTCLGNTPEELVRIVDAVPGVYICFDTNHYVKGSTAHFIKTAGKRIRTVHISDFDFVNECHWPPYEGQIDWKEFMKEMSDTAGYNGVMMFEVTKHSDKSRVSVPELMESFRKMSEPDGTLSENL